MRISHIVNPLLLIPFSGKTKMAMGTLKTKWIGMKKKIWKAFCTLTDCLNIIQASSMFNHSIPPIHKQNKCGLKHHTPPS